ncbi:hypothetical protein IWW47_001149 [Coemansia sp. RSA 2052]|nr:hypothetical protein GGF38_000955 [Coemansia sp. RSA 25]KAJ2507342.1 hypothetical protein IWW47_001149 [Coemansia sp. RSA 2052]
MNFGGNSNNNNAGSGSFASPSFVDKLRMGAAQVQESFKEVTKEFTLAKECERAARILTEFIGDIDDIIPADILQHCCGIAVLSIVKAGFIWTARGGSGVVCARLPNGTWSGPSAIGTGGVGVGGQIGAQLTEVVMILNTDEAVRAFEKNANVQFGSNISVAAGPVGRSGEISAAINSSNIAAAVYSYSKSKGLFAGISVEGSMVMQRKDVNEAFYGRPAPPDQVLDGVIQPPEGISEWEVLRMVLEERCTPPAHTAGAHRQQQQQHRETLYDDDEGVGPIGPTSPTAARASTGTPSAPPLGSDAASATSPSAPSKP